MNTLNSFQDLASIKLILYFTSVVLVLFVGIIGYFLSRRDQAITLATANLTAATVEVKILVKALQIQYEIRQPLIDAALEIQRKSIELNSDRIEKVETRLVKLETEHNLFRCKFNEPLNHM